MQRIHVFLISAGMHDPEALVLRKRGLREALELVDAQVYLSFEGFSNDNDAMEYMRAAQIPVDLLIVENNCGDHRPLAAHLSNTRGDPWIKVMGPAVAAPFLERGHTVFEGVETEEIFAKILKRHGARVFS